MRKKKDVVVIEFTEELMNEWTERYFRLHPRAKKCPLISPAQPSLNQWIILQRKSMNTLKQHYKDYTKFVVEYYGLQDLGICKCKCRYISYRPTKARSDLDNRSSKVSPRWFDSRSFGGSC